MRKQRSKRTLGSAAFTFGSTMTAVGVIALLVVGAFPLMQAWFPFAGDAALVARSAMQDQGADQGGSGGSPASMAQALDAASSASEQDSSSSSQPQPSASSSAGQASSSGSSDADSAQTRSTLDEGQDEEEPDGLSAADPEEDGQATAGSDERSYKLEKAIEGVDGTRYAVTVEYGDDAGIPDGATLNVVQVVQRPSDRVLAKEENEGRPYDFERFVSAKQMAQGDAELAAVLEIDGDAGDRVLSTSYVDIAIEADGQDVQPQAPVLVNIETSAVPTVQSDAIEASFFGERDAFALAVENASTKDSGTRFSFETDVLGELGVAVVAAPRFYYMMEGADLVVLGGRYQSVDVADTGEEPRLEQGMDPAGVVELSAKPARDYDPVLWVTAEQPEGAAADEAPGTLTAYAFKDGEIGAQLFEGLGKAPVAVRSGDRVALTWDVMDDTTLELGDVTLEGAMPAGAQGEARDVARDYADPAALVDAAPEVTVAQSTDGDAALDEGAAAEPPAASDAAGLQTVAAYDISIEADGADYQPTDERPVIVSIQAAGIAEAEGLQVWHVLDDGAIEVVEGFQVDGDTVSFQAPGFSVYVICATYTPEGEGDSGESYTCEITDESALLSAILSKLQIPASAGAAGEEPYLDIAVSDVEKVKSSNVDRLKVEEVSEAGKLTDWKLTPTGVIAATDQITLTLTLKDNSGSADDGSTETEGDAGEDGSSDGASDGGDSTDGGSEGSARTIIIQITTEECYAVTWKNYDGTVLETDIVKAGTMPSYGGAEPSKEQTVDKTYVFSGWTPEVTEVTGDVTYTATFTEEPRKYTITWENYDDTVLEIDQVAYGEVPIYGGEEPVRPRQDSDADYTFAGWDPAPVAVVGDASYKAVYAKVVLEIELKDSTDSSKSIAGAAYELRNDANSSQVVWSGATDPSGIVRLCKVADENNQENLSDWEKGAEFKPGSSYILKQTSTASGYIVPEGTWTIKVKDNGEIESPITRNAVWDDYTTLPGDDAEKYGIRVNLQNAKVATMTYRYNMPVGGPVDDVVESLDQLSYNLNYAISVEDPTADGYEFVGWKDANNKTAKKGATIVINTVTTKDHVLEGCWRAPLKVVAKTYKGSKIDSAAEVADSKGVFPTEDVFKSYASLGEFCQDYGERNSAVKTLNTGGEYEFVQARIGDAVISALRYDNTDHTWQYQKQYESTWTNLAVGDELTLCYAYNKVNVKWVKADAGGNLTPLGSEYEGKTIQIDSASGITEANVFALIGGNANEAIVENGCYFQGFGLGGDGLTTTSGFIAQDLQTLTLKNTVEGFTCGQTEADVSGLGTIYVVYSPDPPADSTCMVIENYAKLSYSLESLVADGVDLLVAGKAIQVTRGDGGDVTKLSIYDGGTGEKHAGKTLAKDGKVELVLLGAAGKAYILKGGFDDTDSVGDEYEVDAAIATEDGNAVTHTLLQKAFKRPSGDVENQLVDAAGVTEGTLDSATGKVTISFDDDLAPFMFEKQWSEDTNPKPQTVNFDVFEIPGASEQTPAGFELNAANDANALRSAGATVWQCTLQDTFVNSKQSWTYQSQKLPKRNIYYAVEGSIMNASVPETRSFDAVYALSREDGGWKQVVTNNLKDNVCRVWDSGANKYEEFKTIQRAVDYIADKGMNNATIEMLCDYVMPEFYRDPTGTDPEPAFVSIPSGFDITLTGKAEDGKVYTVSRGFTGEAMFTVEGGGSLTIQNLKLSAMRDGNGAYYYRDGAGGFVNVECGGTLKVKNGTSMTNGRAKQGSAVFVQDEGTAVFSGGSITENRTLDGESSGAVAVGGADARIELSGDVVITNNRSWGGGDQRNIYLNQDSNEVIQVVGPLGESAAVGVYVPSGADLYDKHGLPSKPFATFADNADGLDKLMNDRYRTSGAGKGYASTVISGAVVWGPTFDLVADVHWLDEQYKPLGSIPTDAQVKVSLNPDDGKGYSMEDQKGILIGIEDGATKHTFKGLAVYQTNGSLCEYYVKQEQLVSPEKGYKQVKFIGDVGVRKVDSNDDNAKNVEIPLRYIAGLSDAGETHVVNLYEHRDKASFTINKIAENLESGETLTSSFELYGVKKGIGVAGMEDLPLALRMVDTPEEWKSEVVWNRADGDTVAVTKTSAFFQVGGGNQWYCQVADGTFSGEQMKDGIESLVGDANRLVKFKRYLGEADATSPAAGDVRLSGGVYQVCTGSDWVKLEGDGIPETRISYTRQDGNAGALNRDGGIQLQNDIGPVSTFTDDGDEPHDIELSTDATSGKGTLKVENLSSEYYWYAVETSVQENGGQGRSLPSLEWLVAAYDPQYAYDQASQTVTVTNTFRNGLATYKKWPENANGGTAKFEVYRLDGAAEPFEEKDLKTLIDQAYGKAALIKVGEFTLPEKTGSYVHVEEGLDVTKGIYFVKEVEANGMTPLTADVLSSSSQVADCLYWPYERLNHENGKLALYKIENQNEILCKVVDPDGTEHPFRTLKAAYEYGTAEGSPVKDEFTIEMLKDYTVPASDTLAIESGRKVTLTTATEGITTGNLVYRGNGGTRAILTRLEGNRNSFVRVDGTATDTSATALTLSNITFAYSGEASTNYSSNGKWFYNGAYVYAANATVTLGSVDDTAATGVEMIGGRSNSGGAIYVDKGSLNVDWARFAGCISTESGSDDRGGGAIQVNAGKLSVSNSEFAGCKANNRNGGAISVINASLADESIISNSTFDSCTSNYWGGAVHSSGFKLRVEGSTFTNCEAPNRGGAISHSKNTKDSSTVVENCTFTNCNQTKTANSDDDGGGAINTKAGELHVKGSTFTDCHTERRGGAIQHYLSGGQDNTLLTEVEGSTFVNCDSVVSGGGAMCVAGLTVKVTDSSFENCRSSNSAGGALDIAAHGKGKVGAVAGCSFKDCSAGTSGGAISMASGEITVDESVFENCKATQWGGAFSMEPASSDGTPYKLAAFNGCRFSACTAGSSGGAVYSKSVVLTVGDYTKPDGTAVHSSFDGCQATKNHGGAIYQEYRTQDDPRNEATTSISDASFKNCEAKQSGGAVRTNVTAVVVEGSSFTACKVAGADGGNQGGGAIYASKSSDDSVTTIRDSIFGECSVASRTDSSGGALYILNKTLKVEDSRFSGNVASGNGGAIYTTAKTAELKGTPFEACEARNGGAVYQDNGTESALMVEGCAFAKCKAKTAASDTWNCGGAIRTNAESVSVKASSFDDCVCEVDNVSSKYSYGGALYITNNNLGTRTVLQGTTFTGCRVTGTNSGNGGSVYTTSRTLKVVDATDAQGKVLHCSFADSVARGHGGGIYHYTAQNVNTELTVSGAAFERCEAVYSGGGIYTNAREVVVENTAMAHCKVENQRDVNGGGLRVDNSGEFSSTTLLGVSMEDCRAVTLENNTGRGGGAYITSRTLTVGDYRDEDENVTHSSFKDCHATNAGGAICQSNKTFSSVTVTGAAFETCDARYYGGAIQSEAITTTVEDGSFKNCKVECSVSNGDIYGGALRVENGNAGTETVVGNTAFDGCYASNVGYVRSFGGAISSNTEKLIVKDGTTITNSHSQNNGGGIYHYANAANSATMLDGLTLDSCYSSDRQGGGVYTTAKTVEVKDSKIVKCHSNNEGGGVYHYKTDATVTVTASSIEDCYARGNSGSGGGMYTNAVKLEIAGTDFLRCHTEGSHGGALYHGDNNDAETAISGSSFKDCYCPQNRDGGAVYHYAKSLTLTDTVIDGGGQIALNARNGGGIYSDRAELTLVGCTVQNCAALNCGGGIYQNSNSNRSVVLDNTKILNNSAANNSADTVGNNDKNNGGGVYFRPNSANPTLTLRNGTVVSGNKLTYVNSGVDVAAGIYLYQSGRGASGTLVVGTQGSAEADAITVWNNTAADGMQSNVRLNSADPYDNRTWKRYNNRTGSVILYSDLQGAQIGVVNPGVPNTQFGISNPSNHSGVGGFVSDDLSMTGKINPSNTAQIIWYKPPVCKITDANGNVLTYTSGDSKKVAVYDSLAEAIRDFNAGNSSEGHFYDGIDGHENTPIEPMQIQMLTPSYRLTSVDADLPAFTRSVTLTTAQQGDTEQYYYPSGAPDAVIIRGSGTGSLFSAVGNIALNITHLTLDGDKKEATAAGSLISSRGATVTLGQDAVLRNGNTSQKGGAVCLQDGSKLVMSQNAAIRDCQAADGGGVYVSNGSTMEMTYRSSITGNSATRKGGAVYVADGGAVNLDGTVDVLSIKDNHVAGSDGGAGIYLDTATSRVVLNGMLDFDGNTVTTPNPAGAENGAESYPYARQDLYLAANVSQDVGSITIAGNLTNGHGDDGFIWVWAQNRNHYKKDDQFAVVKPGVSVQSFTLNAFRDARDDATSGNATDQYYTGVADPGNASRVLWGADIVDVTLLKTDGEGAGLPGAGFTVYPCTGDDNLERDLRTPLKYRSGDEVEPVSDASGKVGIDNVLRRNRSYYLRETTMPTAGADGERANFGDNNTLYRITISATGDVKLQAQIGTAWRDVSKKDGMPQIVNEAVICKVVDTANGEHAFPTLNGAVTYIRANPGSYVNGVATIQMLVDYTVPKGDCVTLETGDDIVLTTAHTTRTKANGERYLYLGDNGETSILRRGADYAATSMMEVRGSGKLALRNIMFDGKLNGKTQRANVNGAFVALSDMAALTVGRDAVLQNAWTSGDGGAVHAAAGTKVTVDGGAFRTCVASGNGGAICALGSVQLGGDNPSEIAGCEARNGGAVYMNGNATELKLANIAISGCKAADKGGAVHLESSSSGDVAVTLVNSQVGLSGKVNTAGNAGGGLYTKADRLTLAVDEASVIGYGRTNSSNAAYGGGAVAHVQRTDGAGSAFTLTGVPASDGSLKFGKVTGSVSKASGGGLDITARSVNLTGAIIEKCDSEGGGSNAGGGVRLRGTSVLTMADCVIDTCNSATIGGGVALENASADAGNHSRISGSTFTACTASKTGGKGGGVYAKDLALDVEACTFGVDTDNSGTRTSKRCQASADGGAIYAENATLNVDGGTSFHGAYAGNGGGICARSSTVNADGAQFRYCGASYGGGVYGNGSTVVLDAVTFDTCSANGGGLHVEDTQATVAGCLFTGCYGGSGGAIRVGKENGKQVTIGDKDTAEGFTATRILGSRATNGNDSSGSALFVDNGAEVTVTGHTLITARTAEAADSAKVTPRSGAIFVQGNGLLHLIGGDDYGPAITDYSQPTVNDNNGPAIYLNFSNNVTYGKVTLEGYLTFENNLSGMRKSGTLGGSAHEGVLREDIFVYMGAHDNANNKNRGLNAITVDGELPGSEIWVYVWDDKNGSVTADGKKHYKRGDQFGISADTGISDATLAKFKNARLDADTGNEGASLLAGVRGDQENWVYWDVVSAGSRTVILRKVQEGANGYNALAGKQFKVCNHGSTSPITVNGQVLEGLVSRESGVFWVGELPYGDYDIVEENPSYTFTITVDAGGVTPSPAYPA